ncbi:type II toxin-antitoxin system death-on-curing family toxin [Luminiphilus sp.]|jgi:death-on-curing protein|nr:type II toxin-antitoxin system death-on-curing family toxin [Luminiphilus sp.]MDB2585975.1 type II toxin-antitoxin system death-on-curing family toxin [Luminiphilus sp.]MDB2623347.1 type II toxin-antitoxin system death-on-curing family toxin [Luminiphilus sp.]
MSFDYIRVEDILAIHADQIERYGGAEGIRDPGLLEAALFRPQTGYYPTLIDEAAALWESLSQSHPFVDGNKRTAFAATYVFLAINGLDIIATDDDAQDFVLGLYATSSITFDNLRAWLSENTKAF